MTRRLSVAASRTFATASVTGLGCVSVVMPLARPIPGDARLMLATVIAGLACVIAGSIGTVLQLTKGDGQ